MLACLLAYIKCNFDQQPYSESKCTVVCQKLIIIHLECSLKSLKRANYRIHLDAWHIRIRNADLFRITVKCVRDIIYWNENVVLGRRKGDRENVEERGREIGKKRERERE